MWMLKIPTSFSPPHYQHYSCSVQPFFSRSTCRSTFAHQHPTRSCIHSPSPDDLKALSDFSVDRFWLFEIHSGKALQNYRKETGALLSPKFPDSRQRDQVSERVECGNTANHSRGTNQSNGTGFFCAYQEPASSSRSNGALTPDYNYAEIGHSCGAGSPFSHLSPVFGNPFTPAATLHGMAHSITQVMHSAGTLLEMQHRQGQPLPIPLSMPDCAIPWPLQELPTPVIMLSRDLSSPSNAPPTFNASSDPCEPERRGRSIRRSLRNTINAAEHLATSLLFGHTSMSGANNPHDSGSSSGAKGIRSQCTNNHLDY